MKKLSLAYFGSPDFAARFLEKLITDTTINQLIEVKFVVTQADKPVGRKQILTPTPVKIVANKYLKSEDIKFFSLSGLGVPAVIKNLDIELKNIDLALVYAYGDLIPKEILSLPKYGFWNIHPSLLPKYRGTSPIATPLINGDKITGVTIIKMDEEIDHGPIIVQNCLTIEDDDKRPDLEKKLTDLGVKLFKKILIDEGEKFFSLSGLGVQPQNHSLATYTKKLSKQDGFISFEKIKNLFLHPTPYALQTFYNLFRGLYPWPGIWTTLPNGKRLKITQLELLRTTPYSLRPVKVQLEGKNEVDFETFNKAYKIF